ncbi:MAG: response regulator [Syntrophobacteraceae bacterium]
MVFKRAAHHRPFCIMASRKQPTIWIIDNNHWERANLRAVLIERGYEVEGFVSIFHALLMFYREKVEKPAVIVLESKNLQYQGAEPDELFRIGVPVILLSGVYEDMELAQRHQWAAVLRRPFTIGQVGQTAERLAGTEAPSPELN